MVDTTTSHEALRFSLAPLQDFDPALLISGDDDVDGFVLSLALAYNDLKSIHWMNYMLEQNKPAQIDALTPISGQWNGMRVQVARWSMALAHEIMHAIARAESAEVMSKPPIRKAVQGLPDVLRTRWKVLVKVSCGRTPASGPLRGYLRDLRNQGVFHYAYTEQLVAAYREFFAADPKSDFNRRAYFSLGPTMNKTRFYFADAAAQRMYCGEADRQALFDEATDLVNELHHSIVGVVFEYLKIRGESLQAVTPNLTP